MAGSKHHLSSAESPSDDTDTGVHTLQNSSLKDQERFLPIANVGRIMKKALPTNAKISKEAKETVQECVSEFISFITGEASDKCLREKRKTINGDDLLWAMTTLGFENYVGKLKVYLNKYRETEEEKISMARQGDRSPTEDSIHHGSHISNGDTNLQGFNGGFFSRGASGIPPSFAGQGRTGVYGEDYKNNTTFYLSTTYGNEAKHANGFGLPL